jgi:hypothetical protein
MTTSGWGTTMILVLATLLAIAWLSWGEEGWRRQGPLTIHPWHGVRQEFRIENDDGTALLSITDDGEISYSGTPTEAAQAFIEALKGTLAKNQSCRQWLHDALQELWNARYTVELKTARLAREEKIEDVLAECKPQ